MKLGNNGRLDLLMGIDKTGPATVQTNGSMDYTVTIYNYTNTEKQDLASPVTVKLKRELMFPRTEVKCSRLL